MATDLERAEREIQRLQRSLIYYRVQVWLSQTKDATAAARTEFEDRMRASFPMPPYCCDLHNMHCEPPSELCCEECGEVRHPEHPPGVRCVLEIARDRKASAEPDTPGETR